MVVALSLVRRQLHQRIIALSLEHVTDARRKHREKMRKITLAAVCALKVKAEKVPEGICSFARAVDAASLSAPWDGNVAQR